MRRLILLTFSLCLFLVSCKQEVEDLHVFSFNATQISLNSAVCGGSISFSQDRATDWGVCWSSSPDFTDVRQQSAYPDIDNESFRTTISNLEQGVTYYMYAYAIVDGECIKGLEKNFTTLDGTASLTTSTPQLINSNELDCGGHIITDGGYLALHCGVIVSKTDNPETDIDSQKVYSLETTTDYVCHVEGLDILTPYYVCAFVETENGIFYGDVKSITTTGEVVNGLNVAWSDCLTNERKQIITNLLMNMVRIQGGSFNMGAQSADVEGSNYDVMAASSENPVHQVTLNDYLICKYQLTQQEMNAIMGNSNDGLWNSQYGLGDQYPAYNLSSVDVQVLIDKLIELTKVSFSLPTEAQWEFAARGGNQSQGFKYSGSCVIDDVAWFDGNSSASIHEVGQKQSNELGLYDMSGNLWEFCLDYFGLYEAQSQTNPMNSVGTQIVVRGGSWMEESANCRVSSRNSCLPTDNNIFTGFRLTIYED